MWEVGDIKPSQGSKNKGQRQQGQQQQQGKGRGGPSKWSSNASIASSTPSRKQVETKHKPIKQNIKALETGSVLIPGRHPCLCEGLKHSLVSNCLNCGRIVCEQEGPGECFTCGELVITKEDRKILREGDYKKVKEVLFFYNQQRPEPLYMGPATAADTPSRLQMKKDKLKQAIEKRDQLIYFDLTSSLRNKVIDEHSDYYNIEFRKWLRPEDRNALKKEISELHSKKFERKQYLDISMASDWGKDAVKVVERQTLPDFNERMDLLEMAALESVKSNLVPLTYDDMERRQQESEAVKLELQARCSEERRKRWEERKKRGQVPGNEEYDSDRERKREQNELRERRQQRDKKEFGGRRTRVQGASWNTGANEEEETEDVDSLPVLRVRQPWASLIMSGIKLVEGRNYPSKRVDVRLRIVAPKYKPSDEEVLRAINFYHRYLEVPLDQFPKDFPTSCSLGTVKLVDCMTQQEWRESVAAEEEQKWFEEIGANKDGDEEETVLGEELEIPDYVQNRIEKRCYIDDPYVWILSDPTPFDQFLPAPQEDGE